MRKELLYFSDLPPLFILVVMEDLSENKHCRLATTRKES